MALYRFDITIDSRWAFEVEADDEDAAYEKLWNIVGYDAEDIFEHESDSEFFDMSVKKVS